MQPFLFNFDAIVRAASARGSEIRKLIDAEIEKKAGVKVLWWQPYGPNVVFGKGSMADPKALAGRNVRVFDEISAKFISDCGGTPHIISDGKQAEAFDMNIVDSSVASVATVNDDELWRKIGTITKIGHSQNLFLVIVNADTFKSLTPKDQERLLAAAQQGRGQHLEKVPGFGGQDLRVRHFQRRKGARAVSRRYDCLARLQLLNSGILISTRPATSVPNSSQPMASYAPIRAAVARRWAERPRNKQCRGPASLRLCNRRDFLSHGEMAGLRGDPRSQYL